MPGRHARTHERQEESDATATSKEIVAVRTKREEIAAALEVVPADAAEAIDALEERDRQLHARLAELQDVFADHGLEEAQDPDEGPPADRSLIPPL